MSRFIVLAALPLFAAAAPSAEAQQSLQAMHSRVPAPPATAATASAWLKGVEITSLRKQLKDQRAFVEKLSTEASANSMGNAGGIDFARAQRDPAYAEALKKKIAAMSQEEQMKLGMQMAQATQQQALQDVQAMAADPEAVTLAAEQYPDYQMKQATGGITAQQTAVSELQQQVRARDAAIAERATRRLKCSDGEGSCSPADQAADKATLRAAHAEIITEYDKALAQMAQHVAAARKARAADIATAQKFLAPAQYGAAARSNANKQLLAAYHNAVLMEVEQLFILAEDVAKFADVRFKDRTINFMPID